MTYATLLFFILVAYLASFHSCQLHTPPGVLGDEEARPSTLQPPVLQAVVREESRRLVHACA